MFIFLIKYFEVFLNAKMYEPYDLLGDIQIHLICLHK